MAIAKMMRVFIVGPEGLQGETLALLQGMGVLHVEPFTTNAVNFDSQYVELLAKVKRMQQLVATLSSFPKGERRPLDLPAQDQELVPFAERAVAELRETEHRISFLQRLREELLPWGYFDPARLQELENAGVFVRRYRMDLKNWAHFQKPEGLFIEVVSEKSSALFYTISLARPSDDIPFATPLPLPAMGLGALEAELYLLRQKRAALVSNLVALAQKRDVIKRELQDTLNRLSYAETMAAAHSEPSLFGIQGWIPQDEVVPFQEKMSHSDLPIRVVMREPDAEEEPPVLLRNNRFIRRIEPLLKLYGSPKYRHMDPSYFFAPFMVLFFGICLSDAGYGALFYLISSWAGKKWGKGNDKLRVILKLCKTFALASIAVGMLTGSFFGYKFEDRGWIPLDVDVRGGNPMILFYLSLALGVIHLTFSYLMGILQSFSPQERARKLALIFVLWGGASLIVRNIWFSLPSSALSAPLFYGGVAAITAGLVLTLLFSSNSKSWLARLGMGVWNIYGLTGLAGDLLSYARLFGLGIATAAIAAVMNQLAGMIANGVWPPLGIPLGIATLFLGHAFNLALSLLGSTIHAARLHFVEAFKNFFEGGGVEYKPFNVERGEL